MRRPRPSAMSLTLWSRIQRGAPSQPHATSSQTSNGAKPRPRCMAARVGPLLAGRGAAWRLERRTGLLSRSVFSAQGNSSRCATVDRATLALRL